MSVNRVEGVNRIRDKICDVIYKRNGQFGPLSELFHSKLSVRRISLITDINDLFDTLDRLELGSITNLEAFLRISDFLRDAELTKLIDDVGQMHIPEHHYCCVGRNLYQYRRANKTVPVPSSSKKNITEDPPAQPERNPSRSAHDQQRQLHLQNRVFDLLACEVGKRWRELGRNMMSFTEAELDEFENRYSQNLRERIQAMLQEYAQGYSNTEEMLKSICIALDQCRRVDLRKKVQQLMSKGV